LFEHRTVLLKETIDLLRVRKEGIYLDCTLGGGGHAGLILEALGDAGLLIGLDQDEVALENGRKRFSGHSNVRIVKSNFRLLDRVLEDLGIDGLDGVVFDLGVSSPQLDEGERGFSYHQEAPLDMRMDRSHPLTAREVVNTYSRKDLVRILKEYGEERWADRIVEFILEGRQTKPLETTGDLVEKIRQAIPAQVRREGGHPARKTFQALRIEVNDELGALSEALEKAVLALKPGGRIAVITFHSLEDRIVKEYFRDQVRGCVCPPEFPVCVCGRRPLLKPVTRRPVAPAEEELQENRRARSARLRVAERVQEK